MQDGAKLGASGAMQQDRPGLGTRLLGEGWEGKAAALGSMLMGNPFAVQQYQGQQDQQRQRAAMMAEQQRQQAQMMAAAQGLGIDPQQAALLGQEGLRQVTVDRMKPQEGPKPGSFEWWSDPARTPQEKATFAQYRDANTPEEPRMVTLPDGRAIFGTMDEIQRVIGGGQGGTAPQVLGQSLPQGWQIEGGAGGNASGNFR